MPEFRNLDPQLEDQAFVQSYFAGCEDGNAVTRKLIQDNATINAPNLIARLVQWLNEASPLDENEEIQTSQAQASLPSSQQSSESSETSSDSGEKKESSDGTSRETQQPPASSTPASKPLFGGSS